MAHQLQVVTTFGQIRCCTCSVIFLVPQDFQDQRRRDGKDFYCPSGHRQAYTETEADRMRRERDRLQQQVAQRDDEISRQKEMRAAAERQASAARGQITRLKNRAVAGICPCCNRTFSQLARHMSQKHPAFKAEPVADG